MSGIARGAFAWVALTAAAGLAFACGDDGEAGVPASGGKGTAGASAHAGSGGAGGTSGKGGAGVSGDPGSSAPGGTGASSGHGGNAGGGSGSSARGGNAGGGNGGMCANEVPDQKLNSACQMVPTAGGSELDTPNSTCSFEDGCKVLHCGDPTSPFDENGCYRTACFASYDCGAGERCVAPPLLGQPGCVGSWGDLRINGDCQCDVGESGECMNNGFCLREADYPAAGDCATAGKSCDELHFWASLFEIYELSSAGEKTDLEDDLLACRTKVERALAGCPGEGGAGGMAGAGGQTGQSAAGAGG